MTPLPDTDTGHIPLCIRVTSDRAPIKWTLFQKEKERSVCWLAARAHFFCFEKRKYSTGVAIECQENLQLIIEAQGPRQVQPKFLSRGLVKTQWCVFKFYQSWGCAKAHDLLTSGAGKRDLQGMRVVWVIKMISGYVNTRRNYCVRKLDL